MSNIIVNQVTKSLTQKPDKRIVGNAASLAKLGGTMRESLLYRYLLTAAAIMAAIANPGCKCAGNGTLKQGEFHAHVGDTVINCGCNFLCPQPDGGVPDGGVDLTNCFANKEFQLCLPPELNTQTANPTQLAALKAMSDEQFAGLVNDYCRTQVTTDVYHLGKLLSGGWCDEKKKDAPDGGVGTSVVCFAQPFGPEEVPDGGQQGFATRVDPTGQCSKQCGDTICDYNSTCPGMKVAPDPLPQDLQPQYCKCNRIGGASSDGTVDPALQYACPGDDPNDLPTADFCQPGPALVDPPTTDTSLLTYMVSKPTTIDLDPGASSATVSLHIAGQTSTRTVPVHGHISFYGTPCPGADCDLLADFYLFPEDFVGASHFHYDVLPDVYLSHLSFIGGTQTHRAHLFADGTGVIFQNELMFAGFANEVRDGFGVHDKQSFTYSSVNPKDIPFFVDWKHDGTFEMLQVPLSADGDPASADGSLTLVGKVTNLPPLAVAGTYPTLECDVPGGARVTLDASKSSDLDGDSLLYSWLKGPVFGPGPVLNAPRSPIANVIAPLGTTEYGLSVLDPTFATAVDRTSVTVQDTTAPDISVTLDPDCFWPPNHRMVLFEQGNGITLSATDLCDPTPQIKIVSVTSNEPATGGGSGSTAPDVAFGNAAFCIRSERDGTEANDRVYTVTFEATDASGNSSTKQAVVTVAHDQASGSKCSKLDSSRIVDDGDPRCVASDPPKSAEPVITSVIPAPGNADETHRNAGCSMAASGPSSGAGLWMCTLMLFLGLFGRRRAMRLRLLALILLSGCSSSTTPQALTQCVDGWWRDPQSGGCLCPPQPECSSSDCQAIGFIGFTPSGTFTSGTVTWSDRAKTFSSEGAASTGTFVAGNGTIQFTRSGGDPYTQNITCSASQLTQDGTIRVRADATLSAALTRVTASGVTSWKGAPTGQ